MKLIIDAQLPSSLANFFPNEEIIHTSQLKDGNLTPDRCINEISVSEKCVVITKDADFYYSYIAKQGPYKLVLVKLGNMRLKDLKEYFERNAAKIVEVLQQNSFIILEPDTIRILD